MYVSDDKLLSSNVVPDSITIFTIYLFISALFFHKYFKVSKPTWRRCHSAIHFINLFLIVRP